jgi:hypothetical protein
VREEKAKRPWFVSVEGREIVGPGFSAGPKTCTAQPEDGSGEDKAAESGREDHRFWFCTRTTVVSTGINPHIEASGSEVEGQGFPGESMGG